MITKYLYRVITTLLHSCDCHKQTLFDAKLHHTPNSFGHFHMFILTIKCMEQNFPQ
eukprot:GAHX01007577.1.p1 GENE.GAHX01007577.1~~GAHX01007577.1.p1  ORF type:complete len:56 (+),score=2.76 GAHX01007577.1:124-291(+)